MKLRRFLDASGVEEQSGGWLATHTEDKRAQLKEEEVRDEEIMTLLSQIDFDYINQILRAECKKAGSDVLDDLSIDKKTFFLMKKADDCGLAEHHFISRLIELFPENIRKKAIAHGVELKTLLLFTIFHEIVHAYSFTDVRGAKELIESGATGNIIKEMFVFWRREKEKQMVGVHGYKKEIVTGGSRLSDKAERGLLEKQTECELFDEGVTNKLALEFLKRYRQFHPGSISKIELDKLFNAFCSSDNMEVDSKATRLVNEVINDISRESMVDVNTVWQAIKRGKLGVENIHDEETAKIMQAELSPDVYAKIRRRV